MALCTGDGNHLQRLGIFMDVRYHTLHLNACMANAKLRFRSGGGVEVWKQAGVTVKPFFDYFLPPLQLWKAWFIATGQSAGARSEH